MSKLEQDILATLRHGHAEPIADRHYAQAVIEITALRQKTAWQPMSSEPNDGKFRFYGLHIQHAGLGEIFEAHYVALDEDGQLILPSGDNFDDWHFTDFEVWCDAPTLPAPASAGGRP